LRRRSYFIIHRMVSHHWHGHKAQIHRNIKNHVIHPHNSSDFDKPKHKYVSIKFKSIILHAGVAF
jgi:hypothetical protein